MTMSMTWIPILCSLMFAGASSTGTYLLTAPQSIQPGEDYIIYVDILQASEVLVLATLQEEKYNGLTGRYESYDLLNVSGTFSKNSTGTLSLPIDSDIQCNQCRIRVRGTKDLQFEQVLYTNINIPVVVILVQTDKALYKPGQTVHWRVFAVFPNLNFYRGGFVIEVKDPNNNRIKVVNNATSASGVVEGDLKLSDQPVFGRWSITVTLQDLSETYSQNFEVAEYQLPTYEVKVTLPPFALLSDELLTGKVKATYTFGEPVKGFVELHVGPNQGPNSCGIFPRTTQIGFEIDGEADFSVPKEDILRIMPVYNEQEVKVTAFVKEESTGVRLNGSSSIKYYSNKYQVKFTDNTPSVFKPGLPYTAYVLVNTPDNKPPTDTNVTVSIYTIVSYVQTVPDQSLYSVTQFTGTYGLPGQNLTVPPNGLLSVDIDIPSNASSITIKATVKDVQVTKTVEKMYSTSNNFIQLSVQNKNIKSGDTVTIKVDGTEPLNEISYEILARNTIALSGTQNGLGQKSFTFDIVVPPEFAPVAHLLAFYTRGTKEIIADSLAFNVEGIFNNKVTVAFTKNESQPNQDISVNVSAEPGSDVYLLAVDQSVLLLAGNNNDITSEKVNDEVSRFDKGEKPKDKAYALSYSARYVQDVFTKAGYSVTTDIPMPYPPPNYGVYYPKYDDDDDDVDYSYADRSIQLQDVSNKQLQEVERIRHFFPETMMWNHVAVNWEDGTASISAKTPDTITSWKLTGFAAHETEGLGVALNPSTLKVFRSFFVSPSMPSTIVRGEQLVITAVVYNYLSQDTNVVVTLKGSKQFQSVKVQPGGLEVLESGDQVQTAEVASQQQGVFYFPILPVSSGITDIEILAQSTEAADGVRKQIVVRPEGAPVSFNYVIFADLDKNGQYKDTVSFPLPNSVVNGSDSARIKVTGDPIGSSLNSLTDLLQLPTGCGEQSLAKLAPNIFVGQYLNSTGQLTDALREKINDNVEAGYQRQLGYQRSDGGFSAFGNSDETASTWLTSYSLRILTQARDFIYVDPDFLARGVEWLADRQNRDGSFNEFGRVLDSSTQGTNSGPGLTAFVLLTFLQTQSLATINCPATGDCYQAYKWGNATLNATRNLESLVDSDSINDQFTLSVVSYALAAAKSSKADVALLKLEKYAKKEGGLIYWSDNSTVTRPEATFCRIWCPPRPQSQPIDIMITSYAILTYVEKDRIQDATSSIRWLITQRNEKGGFASTQDTSLGLQAISAYAAKSIRPNTNMNIKITNDVRTVEFSLTRENALSLQIQELKSAPQKADIAINGTGFCLTEIDISFNTNKELNAPAFDVNTVLLDDEINSFNMMVCLKFNLDSDSGMVTQEISIPSGFQPDMESVGNVVGLKRIERKGNYVVVYFDRIGKTSVCYSLRMTRTDKVARIQENHIVTRAYYSPKLKSLVFWQSTRLRDSTVCDVCASCCK